MERAQGRRGASRTLVALDTGKDAPVVNAHLGLELIVRDLGRALGAAITVLGLADERTGDVLPLARWGGVPPADEPVLTVAGGFVSRSIRFGLPAVESIAPDDASLGRPLTGVTITHAAGASIRSVDGAIGVLCAGFSAGPPSDLPRTSWLLDRYAGLASLCLDAPEALDRLLAGGRIDGLTGCVTQSAFMHELDREIRRAARHQSSVSCCFVDLDRFKRVNDRYGHIHGSRLLASVATTLAAAVRTEDTLGRYGGDEFVLLLPDSGEAAAAGLAERLRVRITATVVNLPHDPIDVSIGVAEWRPGASGQELLEAADEALLAAKAAGGATVLRASELVRTGSDMSAWRSLRPSPTSDAPWVRFCGHCGNRCPQEEISRVCVRCGLGVLISAPADGAPERGDPFLILDDRMRVAAVSKHAQALLGISEDWSLDRHVDEFLAPADPGDHAPDAIASTLSGSGYSSGSGTERTAPRDIRARLRTIGGERVLFRVRSAPCGPPSATLVVLAELD
jgi:diguanylate cyclase (GGDEF)-like protein